MTWIILQFVLLSGLVVLPRLFKSNNRHVARFHVEMTRNVSARKVCVQMMLIVLLLFHFVYMNGHPEDFGILFSTIECAILLSFKTADQMAPTSGRQTESFLPASSCDSHYRICPPSVHAVRHQCRLSSGYSDLSSLKGTDQTGRRNHRTQSGNDP